MTTMLSFNARVKIAFYGQAPKLVPHEVVSKLGEDGQEPSAVNLIAVLSREIASNLESVLGHGTSAQISDVELEEL